MKSLWISSGIVAALCLGACDKETKAREQENKSAEAQRDSAEKIRDAERKLQEKGRENLKDFKEETRSAFVKVKNQELDELDSKIKDLRAKADKSENMSPEAKEAWTKAADEMKRKRELVNDKLKEVKAATAETWEATTRGIEGAVADARSAYERALSSLK